MTPEDLKTLAAALVRPLSPETIFHVPANVRDLPVTAIIDDSVSVIQMAEALATVGIVVRKHGNGMLITVDPVLRASIRQAQEFSVRRQQIREELKS